jgi:hypothetical protein
VRKVLGLVIGGIFGTLILASIVAPIILVSTTPPEWTAYTEPGVYEALKNSKIKRLPNQFETYMWRDFMPICPPGGRPLTLIVTLDSHPPDCIQQVWIIDGENIFSFLATNYTTEDSMLFGDGPKWEPLIYIDVVIKTLYQSETHYLVARDQYIHRTS